MNSNTNPVARRCYRLALAAALITLTLFAPGLSRRAFCQALCPGDMGSAPDGIRGAERLRLLGEAGVGPVEQAPHLVAQVPDDDGHRREPGGPQLLQQRHDHRLPVDREDRLRPALGQGAKAAAFARGHHDRLHLLHAETERPQ